MVASLLCIILAACLANAWLLRRVLRETPNRSRLFECRERVAQLEADRVVINRLVSDLRKMSEEKDEEIVRRDELIRELRHDIRDIEWTAANRKAITAQLQAKLEEIRHVGRKTDG